MNPPNKLPPVQPAANPSVAEKQRHYHEMLVLVTALAKENVALRQAVGYQLRV